MELRLSADGKQLISCSQFLNFYWHNGTQYVLNQTIGLGFLCAGMRFINGLLEVHGVTPLNQALWVHWQRIQPTINHPNQRRSHWRDKRPWGWQQNHDSWSISKDFCLHSQHGYFRLLWTTLNGLANPCIACGYQLTLLCPLHNHPDNLNFLPLPLRMLSMLFPQQLHFMHSGLHSRRGELCERPHSLLQKYLRWRRNLQGILR